MKILDKLMGRAPPRHVLEGEEVAAVVVAGLKALYPDTIEGDTTKVRLGFKGGVPYIEWRREE